MLPELRRYIQHISLSPDSINNDDVCSNSRLAFFILILAVFCGIYVMCDILPGCFPSHEVLTRHYGHPDRKPCKRKSNQVLFNSLFTINIKFLFLHFFLKKTSTQTFVAFSKTCFLSHYAMTSQDAKKGRGEVDFNVLITVVSHNVLKEIDIQYKTTESCHTQDKT